MEGGGGGGAGFFSSLSLMMFTNFVTVKTKV